MSPAKVVLKSLQSRDLTDIARSVAVLHGVTLWELCGQSRRTGVNHARQELWATLYDQGHWSYPRLGDVFRRDHSTIRHGVQAARARGHAPVRGVAERGCV